MKRTLALLSCAAVLAFVSGSTLISAENGQKVGKATVRALEGDVTYTVNGSAPMKVHANMTLEPGSTIITGPDSHCDLSVNGVSSVVRVNADSKIELQKMFFYGTMRAGDRETMLDLKAGGVLGNVKKISGNSRYEIETPHGVAGIRGTDFQITINVKPDGTFSVTFSSITGQVIVAADVNGQTVTHILNTGESWTPGEGDVYQTTIATQQQAEQIARLIGQEVVQALQLPPTPGPQNPFPTGGAPNPANTSPTGGP